LPCPKDKSVGIQSQLVVDKKPHAIYGDIQTPETPTMRRNFRPAPCCICAAPVAAQAGYLFGPPWTVKCEACAGVVPTTANVIRITRLNGHVAIEPTSHLGDKFNTYRAAIEGAKFNGVAKRNEAPVALVPTIVTRLKAAGFIVDLDVEARTAVEAVQAEATVAVSAAASRADTIDAVLQARGLGLFPFQREGVAWLAGRHTALLADPMGLGKTVQTLCAIPDGAPVLVVAPAVAKGVWQREAARFRPDLQVTVLSGRGTFRWPAPGEMVVVNYDILPAAVAAKDGKGFTLDTSIPAPPAGCVLVADEAHAAKNGKAKRTRALRAIADAVRALETGRVWLLTATPMLNRPTELYSVLRAAGLERQAFGTWDQFVRLFGGETDSWGAMTWGSPDVSVTERLARVSLRRDRAAVLPQLPEKTWRELSVEIGGVAKRACDKLLAELKAVGIDLASSEALAQINASGVSFRRMSAVREALATAKIGALVELVEDFEEQNEPVVVFSAHRDPIDLLGKREGWATITGDTPNAKRSEIEAAFQRGEYRGIAATIQAGGVAITLTRAAQAIFIDRAWTPALNSQAEDRVYRIGQDRGVVITTLVGDHVLEERMTELLTEKSAIIGASVDAAAVVTVSVAPVVDFDALAAEARIEAEIADKARAEAKKIAEDRAKHYANENERKETEKAKAKAEKKHAAARARAAKRGLIAAPEEAADRHEARTARQVWAARAVVQLTNDDPDFAFAENGVGFNKADGANGHWLAGELSQGLTPKQWNLTIGLCAKYHGQVGEMPTEESINEKGAA
jgi:hypothetical protein